MGVAQCRETFIECRLKCLDRSTASHRQIGNRPDRRENIPHPVVQLVDQNPLALFGLLALRDVAQNPHEPQRPSMRVEQWSPEGLDPA
ncbi:MAG TPA: hypothetical protein VFO41_04925 [Alphaproteobacteria bacterium]|nr:hypothetical protein [Alphaproteobacteria bacterium]